MHTRPLRVIFAASDPIAIPCLELLFAGNARGEVAWELVALLTNPDSPKGRDKKPTPTEVAARLAELASTEKREIPVLKFDKLDSFAREVVASLEADLLVCFAYGKIFGPKFLGIFPDGGINIHPSRLPEWRGASPIQSAILARQDMTAVSIQTLALEMDSGWIYACEDLPVEPRDTSESLSARAASLSATMLGELIPRIATSTAIARPQAGEPVFCGKFDKADARVDFSRPAAEIDAMIRAFYPWPLAHTSLRGQGLAILEADWIPEAAGDTAGNAPSGDRAVDVGTIIGMDKAQGILVQTGEGILRLKRLQLEKKKALPFKDFCNGCRDLAGSILGEPTKAGPDTSG